MHRRSLFLLLLIFLIISPFTPARAESPLSTLGFAAGVVTVDTKGRDWAYLAWGAGNADLVRGKTFAVYAKAGGPESAAPFTRRAIVARQTDGRAVDSLLSRATFIGFNAAAIAPVIDELFTGTLPPGTNTPGEKIAAAMRSANPQSEQLLFLMGSLHPGVNFALGLGHAEKIEPGTTTFEIRDFDPLAKEDVGLLWRLTVDTDAPVLLPAPGAPVVVRDCRPDGTMTAKSNLVVPLRWAAPDSLRRLALFQRGYLVYRMRRGFAEAGGYHTTPPSIATLHALLTSNAANVKQVSTVPIFTSANLNAAEAANVTADSTTIFFTDSNDAADMPGAGPQFQNGESFYYFVTARDLLGREGAVSPAGLAEVYELSPLDVPREVRAENDFVFMPGSPNVAAEQRLRVSWKQADNTGTTRPALRYLVYRWSSVNDLQLHADDPLPLYQPSATVPHTANNAPLIFNDDVPGAPTVPADAGRLVFYTVRAEATLPCGPVRSPHSGPMSASLRDQSSPLVPGNVVLESPCYRLLISNPGSTYTPQGSEHSYPVELRATRNNPLVDFAEFTVRDFGTNAVLLQERAYFDDDPASNTITLVRSLRRPEPGFDDRYFRITFNTGTRDGKEAQAELFPHVPQNYEKLTVTLAVHNDPVVLPPGAPPDPDCATAHFADPTGTGDIVPVKICMEVAGATREYRMYRRIDDGPPMLIKQGFRTPGPVPETICYDDYALPAGVATATYTGQTLNDQGTPGPLVLIGVREIVREVPRPLLAPIIASGTAAEPTMTLRWFCQPGGLERFQVWISADTPTQVFATTPSSTFSTNRIIVTAGINVATSGPPEITTFSAMHYSPRVGSTELGSGPLFTLPLSTKTGVTYKIFIRPITAAGVSGPKSNAQTFTWTAPAQVGTVPWPARGLPKINANFNAGIVARTLRVAGEAALDSQYPLGIQVGRLLSDDDIPQEVSQRFFATDPHTLIFKDSQGTGLFPCVLYRYHVANAAFPQVSGDLTQVSPLIEAMALTPPSTTLTDPFFCVRADVLDDDVDGPAGIYLRDTQPALKGAAYKYLVVRFKDNGEVADIIPTNVVTLPE